MAIRMEEVSKLYPSAAPSLCSGLWLRAGRIGAQERDLAGRVWISNFEWRMADGGIATAALRI
jgi:hypothetical protein